MITAELVKELREKTGAGMMDCKKALTEVDGDIEKAIEYLREKGLASSGKKAGRIAAEGAVSTYVSEDGKTAAIAEINCETDFVAKNDGFVNFVNNFAKDVCEDNLGDVEGRVKEMIANIGENIVARRYEKVTLSGSGKLGTYIHMGGKIGVIAVVSCSENVKAADEFDTLVKDISMQIAAVNPSYLTPAEVPADVIEKEKEIYKAQAMNEGKSEEIAEKMVTGRIQKMYKEVCLLEQPFVKEDKVSVKDHVAQVAKALGGEISIERFIRYQTGEGIEKVEENFADEIAKQVADSNK